MVEEFTKKTANAIPPKDKDIVSEPGSPQTLGREQSVTEVDEIRKWETPFVENY